jgi:hypothetical protein
MNARALVLAAALLTGCAATTVQQEIERTLPPALKDDYHIFTIRCSKCHSLARPLNSGITDERVWARYVARMRLQPGSGINVGDVPPIMRFLTYYSSRTLTEAAK